MGYAVTLSSFVALLLFLLSFALFCSLETKMSDVLSSTARAHSRIYAMRLDERIRVDGGLITGSTVLLNITNIGAVSVPVRFFKYMDFIVVYRTANGVRAVRLDYDGSSVDRWEVLRVFVNGKTGEIVNPILTTSGSGLWDPFETLEVCIYLSIAPIVGEPIFVLISTPHGSTTSYTVT